MEQELQRAVGGRLRVDRPDAARRGDDRAGAPRDARERRARHRQGAAAERARGDHARPRAAGAVRREGARARGAARRRRHPGARAAPLRLAAPRARLPAGGGATSSACGSCSRRTPGSACPRVYRELSTSRLLVLEFVDGAPIASSSDSPERREAGRQLLEAFYRQILIEGFFHADPHPGNLLWTGEQIVLLDLGMVGELGARGARAADRAAARVRAERPAVPRRGGADARRRGAARRHRPRSARARVRRVHERVPRRVAAGHRDRADARRDDPHRGAHGMRLPASLALSGKAFGQVQLAIAELDPTLDPFQVVGDFLARNVRDRRDPAGRSAALVLRGAEAEAARDAADRGDRARDRRAPGAEAAGRLPRLAGHRAARSAAPGGGCRSRRWRRRASSAAR